MQHNSYIKNRLLLSTGVLAAVLALSACGKKADVEASPAPTDPASPAAVATQNPDPHAAIVAEPATAPDAVAGTGPAEGGTAIGGVVAGQDAEKPRDSGASEPTGGDGATAATTPPAK
jgi:predicted small lipoprotein YifL